MSKSRERVRWSYQRAIKNRCEKCGASTTGSPYTLCGKCLSEWNWMMDWCKTNRLAPGDPSVWKQAKATYDMHCRVVGANVK